MDVIGRFSRQEWALITHSVRNIRKYHSSFVRDSWRLTSISSRFGAFYIGLALLGLPFLHALSSEEVYLRVLQLAAVILPFIIFFQFSLRRKIKKDLSFWFDSFSRFWGDAESSQDRRAGLEEELDVLESFGLKYEYYLKWRDSRGQVHFGCQFNLRHKYEPNNSLGFLSHKDGGLDVPLLPEEVDEVLMRGAVRDSNTPDAK